MVYPYNGHPSWTNRARCWLTSSMRPTTLTTTPSHHQAMIPTLVSDFGYLHIAPLSTEITGHSNVSTNGLMVRRSDGRPLHIMLFAYCCWRGGGIKRQIWLGAVFTAHSLAYLAMLKWLAHNIPFYLKFSTAVMLPPQNQRLSIDIRSYISAVTPSEKVTLSVIGSPRSHWEPSSEPKMKPLWGLQKRKSDHFSYLKLNNNLR